jgi:hypothetical protein
MRAARIVAAVMVVGFMLPTVTQAAIVQYNDRASWLAAIGGASDVDEDFSGFTVDTIFRSTPVPIAMGTIQQVGFDQVFRNLVDVPPFLYSDNNGTNHASCYVNWPDTGPGSETNVEVVFSAPVSAWGADMYGCLGLELLAVDVSGTNDQTILGTLLPAAQNTFVGFVATAGEQIDMVIFRSQVQVSGTGGEGFGSDDYSVLWATGGAGADVSGSKTVSGDFYDGGRITYQVVLTNAGAGDQPDNPTDEFVDVLPPEVTLFGGTSSSGSTSFNYGTNTVTWNGSIPAGGGTVTIDILADVNAVPVGTLVSNQGTVFYDGDGNGTNESQRLTDDPSQPGGDDPTTFAVIQAPAIPTLGGVGLVILVVVLAGIGFAVLRSRRGV